MIPSQTSGPVLWRVDERGVAHLALNRPEVNNAYDGALIEGLLAALAALAQAEGLRAIGLVHEVVPAAELTAAGARIVDHLLANGPEAIRATKAHALAFAWGDADEATFDGLVEAHGAKRRSAEAVEGLASFKEKRDAKW